MAPIVLIFACSRQRVAALPMACECYQIIPRLVASMRWDWYAGREVKVTHNKHSR